MTRTESPEAGFLLADTLVTLTISAFVLVGLTGLSSVLLHSVDRSVAAIQTTDDLDRTMASLSRLIREAARARFAGVEPQPFVFNGDGQRLMFAEAKTGPGRTRSLEVLAFRSDPEGRLMRADSSLPAAAAAPGDLPFGPAHVTYTGPARLRFSYLGAVDTTGKPSWLASWPIGMRMPDAVAVETVDASGRQVLARMDVPLMSDTDIGCLSGGFCGRNAPLDDPSASTSTPPGQSAAPPDPTAGGQR